MAGLTVSSLWRRDRRQDGQESGVTVSTSGPENEKQFHVQQQRPTSENSDLGSDEPNYLQQPKVGELPPGEAEAGGMGRHLGLFSTTFLM